MTLDKEREKETTKEEEGKDTKLSSNDVSEEKSENTESVTTQPRINTEGI